VLTASDAPDRGPRLQAGEFGEFAQVERFFVKELQAPEVNDRRDATEVSVCIRPKSSVGVLTLKLWLEITTPSQNEGRDG
jgi:hypothetical protein